MITMPINEIVGKLLLFWPIKFNFVPAN